MVVVEVGRNCVRFMRKIEISACSFLTLILVLIHAFETVFGSCFCFYAWFSFVKATPSNADVSVDYIAILEYLSTS